MTRKIIIDIDLREIGKLVLCQATTKTILIIKAAKEGYLASY